MRNLIRLTLFVFLAARGRVSPPPAAPKPDSTNPVVRGADVTIDTGAVMLAGTLLMPLEDKPAPAAILIPGSGAATRSGSWHMYRSLGGYLAERGIAVLLCDKRCVGSSTGDWESETFDERAQDVAAMILFLQIHSRIDPDRIGLIGHSQGAYIAPLVLANYSSDVKFVVLLAGSGQKIWDQILTNERAESVGHGLPEAEVDERVADLESQLRFIQTVHSSCRALKAHYLRFVIDYDPAPYLESLTVPTLALYAGLDTQVPPDMNVQLVESALQTADNDDFTIHTFHQANHWFAPAETGTTMEMRESIQGDSYEFVPGFLEMIGNWILARMFDPL